MNANFRLVLERLVSQTTSHRLVRSITEPFLFVQIRVVRGQLHCTGSALGNGRNLPA
jgi:hypothetical protein